MLLAVSRYSPLQDTSPMQRLYFIVLCDKIVFYLEFGSVDTYVTLSQSVFALIAPCKDRLVQPRL